MTQIVAYSDAAGKEGDENSPFVGIGTAIATVDAWSSFERSWRSCLASRGIDRFHFTDLRSGKGPEFGEWTPDQRWSLYDDLVDVFVDHVAYWTSHGIRQDTLGRVNETYDLDSRVGGSFMLTALAAKISAENWMHATYPGVPYTHVIESGDAGQRPTIRLTEELGFTVQNRYAEGRGELYPLHAADLIAGETNTTRSLLSDSDSGELWRGAFKKIVYAVPGQITDLTAFDLLDLIARHPKLFPRRRVQP